MQRNFRKLFVLIATTLAVETSSFGSAAPVVVASPPPDAKLLELAKSHFNEDIGPSEEKLFRAAANGEDADCGQGAGDEADPAKAAGWETGRVIRSDRLKWLCTDPAASELVSSRGISILGARIDGVLNLQWARITYPLQMRRCAFTQKLILERSHLRSLNLHATWVKELGAARLTVDESVTMSDGFKAEGKVEIMNATIGGNFECDAGQFIVAEGIALDASSAKIGSNVSLGQARFEGGVDFSGATISGIFACDEGQFINKKGRALSLDSVRIDRNLFLRRAKFEGEVWLFNAIIGGNFECSGGTFTGSENGALNASSAKIGSNVYLNASFTATRKVAAAFQAAIIGGDLVCSGGTFEGSENGALDASSAKIGSNVSLGQARFEGGVDFNDATISGIFACDEGTFINKKGRALSLDSVKIDHNLFLRKANFQGEVWLYNAIIDGNFECSGGTFTDSENGALDASSAKIGSNVFLRQAHFEGGVDFSGATISGIFACDEGQFINKKGRALSLDSVKIDRNLFLRRAKFEGEVWLYNATIGGNFECSGGTFVGSENGALDASSAKIGSNVYLNASFTATRKVAAVFRAAIIGGDLVCSGGTFVGSENGALDASSAKLGSNVYLNAFFETKGKVAVALKEANIGGDLVCKGGTFICNKGEALNAVSAQIQGSIFFGDPVHADGGIVFTSAHINGEFDLVGVASVQNLNLGMQFAKVGILRNDKPSWPLERKLSLEGFAYDEIDYRASPTAQTQIEWLHRQPQDRFLSQPYEQLAGTLRNMGLQEEARKVMIAKNEDHGRHPNSLSDWCWYSVLGEPLVGYGYRPWNAFFISLLVMLFSALLFQIGYNRSIITATGEKAYVEVSGGERRLSDNYQKFNSLIYSLETFVPLLKLDVSAYWKPNANCGKELRGLHKLALVLVTLLLQILYGNRGAKKQRITKFAPMKSGSLLRCYFWFHIIAGWILTTLWVGGLTGLLKT